MGSSIFGTVIGSPTKTEKTTALNRHSVWWPVVVSQKRPERQTHLWLWWACWKARCPRSFGRAGRSHGRHRGRSLRASAASSARPSSSCPPEKSPACRHHSPQMNTPERGQSWGQKETLLPFSPHPRLHIEQSSIGVERPKGCRRLILHWRPEHLAKSFLKILIKAFYEMA